ncbi:MAG: HIT family protein [Campylobacterota bacterium]
MLQIYSESDLFIEVEDAQIPWLKIFTHTPYKELSDLPKSTKQRLFEVVDIVEKTMLAYYSPAKINIASFGNYVPRVHLHIMARFEQDAYFPEPMWGTQQRDTSALQLPPFKEFQNILLQKLS